MVMLKDPRYIILPDFTKMFRKPSVCSVIVDISQLSPTSQVTNALAQIMGFQSVVEQLPFIITSNFYNLGYKLGK